MSVTTFRLTAHRYVSTDLNINQSDIEILFDYISQVNIWSTLIDPSISRKNNIYSCGNYYCTKREGSDLLLTDFISLHEDEQEWPPLIVNENTVYNMVIVFRYLCLQSVPQFTVTQEGQRYTFTAPNIEPIVIDPDLGKIYNDMIPLISVQTSNKLMEGKIKALYNSNSLCYIPTGEHLDIFYNIFIKNLSHSDATTRYADVYKWLQQADNETIIYNDIKITNNGSEFRARPIQQSPHNFITLILSSDSLLKFLQAWETQLQFCDSFTLVFLGETLRFFEGEPINADPAHKLERHID